MLLLKAMALLCTIRLELWLLPLGAVRRCLKRMSGRGIVSRGRDPSMDRIIWAVATAQVVLPGITCLAQALGAEVLLAQHGYPAELRIGVTKTDTDQLEAHAWVECGGQIVVGELADLSRYALLPPLPGGVVSAAPPAASPPQSDRR